MARVFVITGPSGVGKGTVVAEVRRRHPEVWVSVSVTTRRQRPGEIDGVHYHFVDDQEFDRLVEAGQFLEHAVVHSAAKYGTPRWSVAGQRVASAAPIAGLFGIGCRVSVGPPLSSSAVKSGSLPVMSPAPRNPQVFRSSRL